jgi:hypothetical protein
MFVLTMTNGKKNGTFLEIGAFQAKQISNTFLLEKKFDWKGISIDIQDVSKSFLKHSRNTKLIIENALNIDYLSLLKENKFPKTIDYLQLDIDPALNTLECLKILPFNQYKFSIITYETDVYCAPKEIRDESRNILKNYGYELIFSDVCFNKSDMPFEDWYVYPDLISKEILNKIKETETSNIIPENYFFK